MAQGRLGRAEESARIAQLAHGVGGQGAHAQPRHAAQALAEAGQARERALLRLRGQAAVVVQAVGQAHGLAQAVDHAQLAQRALGQDHVEAVGTQVDRGQRVAVLGLRMVPGLLGHGAS